MLIVAIIISTFPELRSDILDSGVTYINSINSPVVSPKSLLETLFAISTSNPFNSSFSI